MNGRAWFERLAGGARALDGMPPSVLVADGPIGGEPVRWLCVVPDPDGRFPRARRGEIGVDEGWALAAAVSNAVDADAALDAAHKRALVAIVDVPGQAFGYREELLGIHVALAAAVDAYARARTAGHPVVALVVGRAISGAFLAHGMQAGAVLALRDPRIEVHVMSAPSVARVTQRSPEEIATLAEIVPSTARDVESFRSLGGIDVLIGDPADVEASIARAIEELRRAPREPRSRLDSPGGCSARELSRRMRAAIDAAWNSAPTTSSASPAR